MKLTKKEEEMLLLHLNVYLEKNKHLKKEVYYKELEKFRNKIVNNYLK